MRKPSVFESQSKNGGYLGGAGMRKRHRFDLGSAPAMPAEAKTNPKPPAAGDTGYEMDGPELSVPASSPAGDSFDATPKPQMNVTIHVHPHQMKQLKKMQRGR